MTLLVFGKTGQVSQELPFLVLSARFPDRDEADMADPAASTDLDRAEAKEAAATCLDGDASTAMPLSSAKPGIAFLKVSTDYIFDGNDTAAVAPDHATAPLGTFGRSKPAGEVTDISGPVYPTPAKRSGNSRTACCGHPVAFGFPHPDWKQGLRNLSTALKGI